MTIEYSKLQEKILNSIRPILNNGTPKYTDEQIANAIKLFFKVIREPVHPFLNGLSGYLETALNEAYITKIGELGPLEIISVRLEAFLKKISILCKGKKYDNVGRKTLIALYKETELNTALNQQANIRSYPQLEEENLVSFEEEVEYLYSLCYTRLTRNTVHDAPDWSEVDVIIRRNNAIVIYIYTTLIYTADLQSKIDVSDHKENSYEQSMLYDFFTFGKETTSIREQILISFILHHLNTEKESNLVELIKKSNDFFEHNVNSGTYSRLIRKLETKKKIKEIDSVYSLTEKESERINKTLEDFSQNKEAFLTSFKDLASKYNLDKHFGELLQRTKLFFENNYQIDLYEILDKAIDLEKDTNQLTKDYYDYLKLITGVNNGTTEEELFIDILNLCSTNDFLLRLSSSQIFTNLTNSRDFQHYVNQTRRIVFLDTQIILYALLYSIEQELHTGYDNVFYKIVEELIIFSKKNGTIELNFSPPYVGEVSYQLKKVLSLIPYDAITNKDVKLSTNVFYEYYWWIKKEGFVEDDYSLADFMDDYFNLYEDDIYNDKFRGVVNSNIYDFLTDIGVEVPEIPRYTQNEIDNAVSVLEYSIKGGNSKEKYGLTLKNDALMACHLSNKRIHVIEPIFLTWDKSFTLFRKNYVRSFNRTELLVWHLFNPAKFLNHISLLKMKINPQAVANEFLSIIDRTTFKEQMGTIYDVQSKFVELSSTDKKIARKNTKILKTVFENVFENEVSSNEIEVFRTKITHTFDELVSKLIDYLQSESTILTINDYKKVMKEESLFTDFSNVILLEAKENPLKDDESKLNKIINFLNKEALPE